MAVVAVTKRKVWALAVVAPIAGTAGTFGTLGTVVFVATVKGDSTRTP